MKQNSLTLLFAIFTICLFLLACRTAELLSGQSVAPTTTARATRLSQRATFTPIPTDTDTPLPSDTPQPTVPTDTPQPTDEPSATRRPATARPKPTQTPVPPTRTPKPSPTATQLFEWITNGGSSCTGGDNTKSTISGKITANGKGAVGQRVQVSSGPGGEPASDPNLSNSNGNYIVTLTCGTDPDTNQTKACNGDFYIWMIDPSNRQISPFVKFGFSNGCRAGKQDFIKR